MKLKTILFICCALLVACSSRSLKKDYQVVDASQKLTPVWTYSPSEWLDDNESDDMDKFKYYTFSSEPKNSRVSACELAKLRANSEIASEVTQFIKHSLSTSTEGDTKALDSDLDEYMDETLTKEVQSHVVGAQTIQKYWEKRNFKKELGAKKDISGYTCSVLIKMSKANMKRAFDMAFKKLETKSKQYNLKEKIEKAKAQVQKEFL